MRSAWKAISSITGKPIERPSAPQPRKIRDRAVGCYNTAVDRLRSLYRKTGWAERLFLVLLVAYLLLRWLAPLSTNRQLAEVALILTGLAAGVKWARKGVRQTIWRLRNRLVVAYLFIAVVPIVLILVLVAIVTNILTGQMAVYLVTSELERRAERLAGQDGGPRRGRPLPALVLGDDRYYFGGANSRGRDLAASLTPITSEVLENLVPNLGEITLNNEVQFLDRDGKVAGSTRIPAGAQHRGGRVPPAANRFDMEAFGLAFVPISVWGRPGPPGRVVLGVTTRPSAVLSVLFGGRMDFLQGFWGLLLLIMSVLFLVFELIALVIGVSMTRAITGAVHGLYEGTRRVMEGDFTHRIEVRGRDQLADLGQSFNRMTENLQRLLQVEKEQERLQAEIEIAREVQNQLYPKSVPSVAGLELVAACSPARMVSGDYYDYLKLDESKIALAIGDVAGKGISAALLMATVQASLRTQIRGCLENAARGAVNGFPQAAHLVSQLNQQLYNYTSPEKFATFYFGIYDDATGELTYTNAGHPPPILVRGQKALRLETNGIVVGAFAFSEYGESRVCLQAGDLLVCFTDGITEAENEYGEMFGEERLTDLVLKHGWRKPAEVIETVLNAVRQWASMPEAQDDMTLLIARRL